MAECNVNVAIERIKGATRNSRIAVFTHPTKPWLLDTVFDATIETRKALNNGRWIGSFCQDDFIEVVERVLQAAVKPAPTNIPTI